MTQSGAELDYSQGIPGVFGCVLANVSADPGETSTAAEGISMVKKKSILGCPQSLTHPLRGPNPGGFALWWLAPRGAAHFSSVGWKHAPRWDTYSIPTNALYSRTSQNQFSQPTRFPPDGNFPAGVCRQQRAGRLRRSRRAIIQFGQELQPCPFSLFIDS